MVPLADNLRQMRKKWLPFVLIEKRLRITFPNLQKCFNNNYIWYCFTPSLPLQSYGFQVKSLRQPFFSKQEAYY